MKDLLLFTGGYTEPILMGSGEVVQGSCKGIACYRFEQDTGKLKYQNVTASIPNPSYILVDPTGPYLYCVNELKDYHGVEGSTVSAFEFEPQNGRLRLLNRQFTCGSDACHLSFSPDRKHLLVANYSGGSFCILPILGDHSLGTAVCVLKHQGRGVNLSRQESPHPHQTILSPGGEFIFVSDLGLDRLVCYQADWEKGWMRSVEERDIKGLPGQGIRHGVFHKSGDYLYVMTELSCEINVYRYYQNTGKAEWIRSISAFLEDSERIDGCLGSGLHLHPTGRWLYCSVRGSNHIGVFEIREGGELRLSQVQSSGGETPREFIVSPDGKYLLVGNQYTNNICVFNIHPETGCLRQSFTEDGAGTITTFSFWGD